MGKSIIALALAAVLVAALGVVPNVRAELVGRSNGLPAATPLAPSPSLAPAAESAAVNFRSAANMDVLKTQTSSQIAAFWTPERIASAKPVPDSDFDLTAWTGPVDAVAQLTQADGPATMVSGYGIGGSETASFPGLIPGSHSGTPAVAYPYAFDRSNAPDFPEAATFGKLYGTNLTFGSDPFFCSGTSVTSGGGIGNMSLVLTAAHCLYKVSTANPSGWSTNLIFVPEPFSGSTASGPYGPYSFWTSFDQTVSPTWISKHNMRADYGFVVMDSTSNPGGALGSVVGAQGLAWNQKLAQEIWAFGYPSLSPFTGDALVLCTGQVARLDSLATGTGARPMALGCDMNGGADGGAWIAGGKFDAPGYANSLNDYKYVTPLQPNAIYGAYFATSFSTLWNLARVEVPHP